MKFTGSTQFYDSSIPVNRALLDNVPTDTSARPVQDYDYRPIYRVPHTIAPESVDYVEVPNDQQKGSGGGLMIVAALASLFLL